MANKKMMAINHLTGIKSLSRVTRPQIIIKRPAKRDRNITDLLVLDRLPALRSTNPSTVAGNSNMGKILRRRTNIKAAATYDPRLATHSV
jgi:hypothetical protein